MKNAIFILVLCVTACVTKQEINKQETFISTGKKVDIIVTGDSLYYSMVIMNRVDSLTFDQVATNFMTLIENQPDTIILADLLNSFKNFAGYDYANYKYEKITKQFQGKWTITGDDINEEIELTNNYTFKFPNLLAINYNDEMVYFSVRDKNITGNYKDKIVKLIKNE